MSGSWLQSFAPGSRASARLFCFPHAGGGAAAFRLWPQGLPRDVEVCAVQLPGRASRFRELALGDMHAIADAFLPELMTKLDLPFAFFGHSMGSMLAHAATLALARRDAPLPVHFFASSRRPPRMASPETPLHVLSDADFVAEVMRRYGGIPAEVLAEPELLALLLPALRADMLALETYRPHSSDPLPCPVSAFGGAEDPLAPRAHLEAWRDETRSDFRVRQFPGGHFYLDARRAEVLADVAATLAPAFETRAPREASA